jgi:molecular chaperone GrpE
MSEKQPHDESLQAEIEQAEADIESAEVTAGQEEAALEEAQEKANEHFEQLLRLQAEIENIKRRSERELANAHKYATEKFVKELLAVVDSLEMAIQNSNDEQSSLREGIELTHKLFLDTLAKHSVTQHDPEGEPFDPEVHEAVSMQPNAEVDANTVLQVVQKGYTLNGRLVRPALVVVSN